MPIADRGYRPYEGPRLPSRRNHWVIARMEARRIWSSLLVKIVVILSVFPPLVLAAYWFASSYLVRLSARAVRADETEALAEHLGANEVFTGIEVQHWLFVVLMTAAWGSAAIASDARDRSLQFYFAKPVTPATYLLGKIIPLSIYCAVICFVPAVLTVAVEAALLRNEGLALSRVALLLPGLVYAVIVGVVASCCSVAISSLSRSRVLTLSLWSAFLFVPLGVAWVVKLATRGNVDWPYLASLPAMLRLLGKAIFRLETEGSLHWYHALAVVVVLTVSGLWVARRRLAQTEVVG